LRNSHTGEEIRIEPFDAGGRPTLLGWLRLDHAFRSWRTREERAINPRLLRVLTQIQRHFDGRRIELLSGYRVPLAEGCSPPRTSPQKEAASSAQPVGAAHVVLTSYHQVGRAADIRIEGVPMRTLFDYCRTLEELGCGLYPQGSHVHAD